MRQFLNAIDGIIFCGSKRTGWHLCVANLLALWVFLFMVYCGVGDMWHGIQTNQFLLIIIGGLELLASKHAGLYVLTIYCRCLSLVSKRQPS